MNEKETGVFSLAEMCNEETSPSDETRAFMDNRTKLHLHNLECRHAWYERMRPTKEERDLKSRLHSSLLDKLHVRDDYERLHQLARERLDAERLLSRLVLLDETGSGIHFWDQPPADDEVVVWWAKTTWFWPVNKATIWMDGDGVHIAAKFEIDDGDLHKYSIKVVAQFEVRADRMPPKGRKYLSSPIFDVSGQVYGFANVGGLFDFGDKWSKCWLNTKQTVFILGGQAIATTSDLRRMIFMEEADADLVNLPGLMGLPVSFILPSTPPTGDPLVIELEWQFDVQLEGDAFIWLGHTPDAQVCTIRHPQWPIRRI